jgi:hypothetical protein
LRRTGSCSRFRGDSCIQFVPNSTMSAGVRTGWSGLFTLQIEKEHPGHTQKLMKRATKLPFVGEVHQRVNFSNERDLSGTDELTPSFCPVCTVYDQHIRNRSCMYTFVNFFTPSCPRNVSKRPAVASTRRARRPSGYPAMVFVGDRPLPF